MWGIDRPLSDLYDPIAVWDRLPFLTGTRRCTWPALLPVAPFFPRRSYCWPLWGASSTGSPFAVRRSPDLHRDPPAPTCASHTTEHLALETEPDRVSFGVLRPGRQAVGSLKLSNSSSQQVRVERIQTSCPRVSVTPSSMTLGPGETVTLAVTFDPRHYPDFRGRLSADVVGLEAGQEVCLRTRVDVEVRAEEAPRVLSDGGGARAAETSLAGASRR